MVLRGAPSILRKRSIQSKRQCEHCRSCCVYAVGLSVALYAVPVARATAADLSMLRIPPPRCVEGGLSKMSRRLFLKVCLRMCVCGSLCRCSGQRAASSEQRAANSEQRAASSEQRAANSEQRAANNEQRAASSQQRAASSEVRTASSKQRAASSDERAARSEQQEKHAKTSKNVPNRPSFPTRFRHCGFRLIFGGLGGPK